MDAPTWSIALLKVLLTAAIGWLAGMAFGQPAVGAGVALAALLLWQFVNIRRLVRWVRSDNADLAPEIGGAWGEAIAAILRLFRRRQFHKQRLLRLLREVRQATAAIRTRMAAHPRLEKRLDQDGHRATKHRRRGGFRAVAFVHRNSLGQISGGCTVNFLLL